jgi:hypothetical protein
VEAAEDNAWVWGRFCTAVWDSLAKGAARDLLSFRKVCEKLWRPFTTPIVDGTFGTRDFARLMVSRRTLFQNEDALISGVLTKEQGEIVKSSAKGKIGFQYGLRSISTNAVQLVMNCHTTPNLSYVPRIWPPTTLLAKIRFSS